MIEPESSVAAPERSNRISAPSKPAAAARSIVLEMPSPRSLPRRRRASGRKAGDVGELQRHVHALLERAAVVGEGEAGLERHGVGADVVAPPVRRVDGERVGREIDHALDHVGRLGTAVAAIGPHRVGVGEHRGGFDVHGARAIDAGERAQVSGEAGMPVCR